MHKSNRMLHMHPHSIWWGIWSELSTHTWLVGRWRQLKSNPLRRIFSIQGLPSLYSASCLHFFLTLGNHFIHLWLETIMKTYLNTCVWESGETCRSPFSFSCVWREWYSSIITSPRKRENSHLLKRVFSSACGEVCVSLSNLRLFAYFVHKTQLTKAGNKLTQLKRSGQKIKKSQIANSGLECIWVRASKQ